MSLKILREEYRTIDRTTRANILQFAGNMALKASNILLKKGIFKNRKEISVPIEVDFKNMVAWSSYIFDLLDSSFMEELGKTQGDLLHNKNIVEQILKKTQLSEDIASGVKKSKGK